jgi:hypothetical protein
MVDMTTRDEIYRRFGPMLLEAIVDILMDEINILRDSAGLSPRTKQQLVNALENKYKTLNKYDWMGP